MNLRPIVVLVGLLALLSGGLMPVAAQQATPAASPIASPVPPSATPATDAADPARQLVDRYAPIIGLKDQEAACDADGEPYYPVSVDVVLGNPDVALKRATGSSSSSDEVVMMGPVAADLFAKGDGYYLDLPGNPRRAGCSYETWFRANNAGYQPTTYAHIVADGSSHLVIQYWFYYVFNRFNNTHESDWEMIQVLFDVGTVEEALQVSPVAIAAAQHGGGETAGWDDPKLQRDGDHPIVFAAAGSHATQYGQAIYLGWGENGTGFGCDITTTPTTLVPLDAVLLPDTVPDPTSEFAWLNYQGRWGERQGGEYNGPTGPATKFSWKGPFTWQTGLRESSTDIPVFDTLGPAPADAFCTLSTAGSNLYRLLGNSPLALVSTAVAIVVLVAGALRYVWPSLMAAMRVYRRRARLFVLIGLFLIPVGIAFNGFQYLFSNNPPGREMLGLVGRTPASYYVLAIITLVAQHLASLLVVGPMVIEVYDEMVEGRRLTFQGAFRSMVRKLPDMLKAVAIIVVVVGMLGISVVLVPVAIWLVVRWLFAPQATMLDDTGAWDSLRASSAAVSGRWWRVLVAGVTLFIVAAAPGVLIGLYLMIFQGSSVQLTNMVSSVFYVISIPLTILTLTLIYRDRLLTPPMFMLVRRLAGRGKSGPELDTSSAPDEVAPAR